MVNDLRIGSGYDIHKIKPGNKGLIVGGICISRDFEFMAHSDGDLLIHSLIDSLLGGIGESDIGEFFPDNSKLYKDISSVKFLQKVMNIISDRNVTILNIDSIIILESPKFSPYKKEIIKNVSSLLNIDEDRFNIKAKSKEGIGTIGEGKAIECFCTSLLYLNPK